MDAVVSGPAEGERTPRGVLIKVERPELLEAERRELRVKVARLELDVLEFEVSRGYDGPGPHFHKRHVDSFYILEGELELTVDGESPRADAGALVAVPPRTVHAFTNGNSERTRFLNVHAPDCGFTEYVRARARGQDVDPERFDIWED